MIDDPVMLHDNELYDRDSTHHDFFLCAETTYYYPSLVIKLHDRLIRIVTYPDCKHKTIYHISYSSNIAEDLQSETLIDMLRSERPECLEWLLFHPEWL